MTYKLPSALLLAITICAGCNQSGQTDTGTQTASQGVERKLTSDQIRSLLSEALWELDKKNFGKSIEITLRITKSDSGNIEAYLIESQAKSMTGDPKSALDALDMAFKNGLRDFERIAAEKRFDPIRPSPEFQELLRRYGGTPSAIAGESEIKAGNVSIKEESGAQVIRAGDISIRVPKD
jgi:hypothetical protein